MKVPYSAIITFLLVWETVAFVRVGAERDELKKQLVAMQGMQTETIAMPDDQDVRLDTQAALPSTDEPMSSTASAWTATEWADRIREIAPANITLKEVAATADYVSLVGEAKSTSDIAILMRAIDQAELGSTQLQQAMRVGDVPEFTLGVNVRRSPSMLTTAY